MYYLVCLFRWYEYYLGHRDSITDTFPPHAEGAD